MLYLKKPFDPDEVTQLAHSLSEEYNNERVKDRFIANVSHELITPLASIQGFSHLLQKSPKLNEEENEYVKIINKNTYLMKEIIDDLITISSLERSCLSINFKNNFGEYDHSRDGKDGNTSDRENP